MKAYPYDSVDIVEVLTGWFWMVRRKALQMVGGLDEQFFMYGEDIDWCHRFGAAGWRVVFYPDAAALHYGGASSELAPARFYVEMRRAISSISANIMGRTAFWCYRAAVWIHELLRVFGYSALYAWKRPRRREAAFKVRRSIACMRWLLGDISFLLIRRK